MQTNKRAAEKPYYTKEQLMKAKTLELHKDVLDVVLDNQKTYTKDQAKRLVFHFLEREV